ncbi:MAG: divergent polysaccharide deacetylase family protein [Pseudomonadales bacterium]|nr:divergent polysaccharide deacetylase family protein [Pseudomonadales bacterium]
MIIGLCTGPQVTAEMAYIAIIIDDIGNNKVRGEQAIQLPGSITFAILPYAPFAALLSKNAHTLSKEVIIHLPMANLTNQPLGPGGLTGNLNKQDFLGAMAAAISMVPHARGINNHTGSYLTQQTEQMTWLMDEIKHRDFFFIDSRTTNKTVAQKIAREKHILSSSRDVFLDNKPAYEEIHLAFQKLIQVAKRKGTAIGIGHPYRSTIDYLQQAIPLLAVQDIQLLPASNVLALQQIRRQQIKRQQLATITSD